MKKLNFIFISVLLIVLSYENVFAQDETADLVLWNGKIITVDAGDSIAEAVAVKDSLILAVGTNEEV